ncbi:hypothetical protein D3C83_83460 [compost metagenome]
MVEDFADVGFAAGAAILERVKNLREVIALGARRDKRFDAVGEGHHTGGVLLLQD